jgi:ABC-2 type transport system ATP-binding protein
MMSDTPGGPAITLENVTKRFGSKVAVDGLTLSVARGELFAFLGPNGAGKTTTIKMIAGLCRPDAGNIAVCGHRMGEDGLQAKAQMAYVPDQPFIYDKLTGNEFLRFVGEMYRLHRGEVRRRLAQLVDCLDMGGFLDQLSEGYSHGMKQRVVLASALLHDPTVIVVDEPMVGLDPRTVRTVKNLFTERTRQGGTVFMSTHTLEVAEAVADRIGIIHRGRLLAVGTLAELRRAASDERSFEDIFLQLTADETDPHRETLPT